MTVWYDPKNDHIYLHDGTYAETFAYSSVGGYKDSDGDTGYLSSILAPFPEYYDWIKLGDL